MVFNVMNTCDQVLIIINSGTISWHLYFTVLTDIKLYDEIAKQI